MKTWITTGGCRITRIIFGRSNVYLLSRGEARVLIDTGSRWDSNRLYKRVEKTGRPMAVIMTHTHFDHAGNAGMLRKRFSPLFIVHTFEKDFLESGDSPVPKGTMRWTRFIYNLGAERVQQWFHVEGVPAGIVLEDKYDLSEFGFNGFILNTPGHSSGSVSVVIDQEIAIVGDTLGGFITGSVFPPWGDDTGEMIRSWKKLLDTGCKIFLPAHGFSISREKLETEYSRRSDQLHAGD